ncbi:atypical/PIKK/TRRAP protein kinase [Obba rivulosa]|uniref:Atypical/PIKK/TRRAP protein kinase n=1 Tax=Obba rivulosa TaxID=1052685 RepID=A0A8E2DR20_9APHY|nr:atypical/PIKK/TRRAP protein kinase [Obba rivulosa]
MDNTPQLPTAGDLEQRAARVADPGIDLKTKYTVACELREMIDTVRDAESARVLPHMIPVLLDILRSGEPSFNRDSLEYQFRRCLLDILHRIPSGEVIRQQILSLFHGMLHLLRHDNEENGIICCKTIMDLFRSFRTLNEDLLGEFMGILHALLQNVKGLVEELLSEDSRLMESNMLLPASRSFKVLSEMAIVVVAFLQMHRNMVQPVLQSTLPLTFEFVSLESPAQRKAREDFEAMGGFWAGMAPTIKNVQAYTDLIVAQTKMLSFLAFVLRGLGEQYDSEGERMMVTSLRILQDCPSMAVHARKDLMVVFRHLLGTPHKRALLPQIDKLIDERVLLGTAIGSQETIRPSAFACFADLIHHLRGDLTPSQLTRICNVYLRHLHNPFLANSLHILAAKTIYNLIDVIIAKDTQPRAARMLLMLLDASVSKVESIAFVQDELRKKIENRDNNEPDPTDTALLEKSRPVLGAVYATEKAEDILSEYRMLVRYLFHGLRHILTGLKKCDAPVPDGAVICRLFESCIRCIALFDGESREANEAMDWMGGALCEINLHVFQEVWTRKIEFYFEAAEKRPVLLHLSQFFLSRETISPTLVAIILRFLVARLGELGDYDDQSAAVAIRLFKMTFSAVTLYPAVNEPILASHLGKLIMDCFPLASSASKPTNYFHLLRGLFRAIGGGGGRYELLYKEVLPLLPDMLECLNRQLLASDGSTRDMIVELCLTVPLRLTHLLPYLTYLMQPLALALRGSPELVSQGLRTLELCIDNLTPDFLDPTLNTVLRDLMEALHSHLKPLPANHHHAHTTIRILGKLGGRNRRLLDKEPALKFVDYSEPTKARISFAGEAGSLDLGPASALAYKTLLNNKQSSYHAYSFTFLESCSTLLLHEGVKGRGRETIFVRCLTGMYEALHLPELQEKAEKSLSEICRFILAAEIRRIAAKDPIARRYPSPLFGCFLEAMPHGVARDNAEESKKTQQIVFGAIQEVVGTAGTKDTASQDVLPVLHQLATRFTSLCLEEPWAHKVAGYSGIRMMTSISELGMRWTNERKPDLVRILLHVLKDMPYDLPRDVDDIIDVLTRVLRVNGEELKLQRDDPPSNKNRLFHLVGIFFSETSSPNSRVREAVQVCIGVLAEISDKPVSELLMPHRDRVLTMIYTKPLRALPFPMQIGMIEAIRYCLSLHPPLPELNDELLRLLHEALALADADDMALIGRGNVRQGSLDIIKLRVACIKLLTASMPLTDYYNKQAQTRQRVTGVYFKSLYSPATEVKEVAHEGLRTVLAHQSRLPKELLQTGLRPVLMNLADPKRLSIPGLEGLARLLELLTNYFKVEIGHKLLDHFRIVADPQMLQASSKLPLSENEGITKLVRLANIFHLLPSAANIFLENLVNAIVQTEAQMHFSGQSPFSEPLAKYLDRYPAEAVDFFMRHLHFPRHIRTLRSILQAKLAPNLLRELTSRTSAIVSTCLTGHDPTLILPGLQLCSDLAELVPGWITENDHVIDTVLVLWKAEPTSVDPTTGSVADATQRHMLMLAIFIRALEETPRIDLLFDVVAIFTRELPLDLISVSQFLYKHAALSENLAFRRNIILRFFIWFGEPSYPWSHKAHFIRFVLTPIIFAHALRENTVGLLDNDIVQKMHTRIWQPMIDDVTFVEADDIFKIELLHLTTVMVHSYPKYLEDVKKDIIKCAWHYITSEDAIVNHTAYLLAARFFEAYDVPPKFILRVWTGLLRPPHSDVAKALIRQALDVLAPVLQRTQPAHAEIPQWAKTARRLLAEEGSGFSQIALIYHLIVRQATLFYPVRSLFIPHIVNYLNRLGLSPSSNGESRLLSVDILQVIFDWEQKATAARSERQASSMFDPPATADTWATPLAFRESMVSYLVRLATAPATGPVTAQQDAQARSLVVPRALALLRLVVGPTGWNDVTVKLHYFSRALEQTELNDPQALSQAQSAAKVLNVVSADKDDSWYTSNTAVLTKLVRKGLTSDDHGLQDSLHSVFDHLIRLFPLPKEDEEQPNEISDFHSWVHTTIGENLREADNLRANSVGALRGTLLMLKSVVQVTPERIEPFGLALMKLFSKLAKDHLQSSSTPNTHQPGLQNGQDLAVRLLTAILEICQTAVAYLGEQRKWLIGTLTALVDKSKNSGLCRFMLEIARDWVMNKRDPYPTMKEKATLLQKMAAFETRGERGEALFNAYLELIYDIYTDPGLRRTDLTMRLEQSFLLGCRAADLAVRERFIDLLDSSIPRSLSSRLTYIVGVQSWEPLATHYWIPIALHLLLGSADVELTLWADKRGSLDSFHVNPPFSLGSASSLVRPVQRLLPIDSDLSHDIWVSVFPSAWACLTRREQVDLTNHMIGLLSKEFHIRQAELRPNVIQTLLVGIHACSPPMILPPHLVKYLAKTFAAWHIAVEILESSLQAVRDDETVIRDTIYDSLAEVYAELAEDDIFYGLWRRRSMYQDTNIAVAFEQCGMWEQASAVYENAQNKTRTGAMPFSEVEFCLWEDHWMLAAEKLQHWDILYELAEKDSNHELMLESAWRIKDWNENMTALEEQIALLPEVATPRRRVFEAFIALLKLPGAVDKNTEFTRILEDAMQLSLRKWAALPPHLSAAHVPLLQHFQQFVELQEAVQIFGSLSTTNAQNLEKKSSDLKMVLQAWRERLPNICDDISIWSDLVAWRQNVFNAINKAYIPLISGSNQGGSAAANSSNTFGYRGYHETAWIINRFAHVARKHDLLDVCFNSLNKIYTLPNIEISEAFLKLREQARCHYQKPGDLQAGLEVINNTNLMYFSSAQKAEFYTLKGMFHAKFNRNDEANQAFGQAVQLDMLQAKAWAAWGKFNDRMFKEHPTDMTHAANAVSCYLQAAGLYKNRKSRPLLTRVLWLLSVDDGSLTVSKAFDTYKGDAAYWYWITLIPELCLSVSQREFKQAKYILLNLAKIYPQALFFHLRTTREEMALIKRQTAAMAAQHRNAAQRQQMSGAASSSADNDHSMQDTNADGGTDGSKATPGAEVAMSPAQAPGAASTDTNPHTSAEAQRVATQVDTRNPSDTTSYPVRQTPDNIDDVMQILKTAFPLLILSLESIVDQIQSRFKATAEEEIYRLVCMLLQDGIQQYVVRMASDDDGQLAPATVASLTRLALNLTGIARKEYEEDFVKSKPSLYEYIRRLQQWRDKYEKHLDARPKNQSLETISHYLTEFQYGKFDEVEVPGQYTEDKDSNQNFVRIQKFASKVEHYRSHGYCWRRITIIGNDNSRTTFAVQQPSSRQSRREERVIKVFRTFNGVLYRKKESRKRTLHFHLPATIPLGPNSRLWQSDSSYVTLGDIYDRRCDSRGIAKEDPILLIGEKVKIGMREFKQTFGKSPSKTEFLTMKKDLMDEVVQKYAPEDILTSYMIGTMEGPCELWRMRKQFSLQLAGVSFMTYIFCLTSRLPSRFHVSRSSGEIAMTELLPGAAAYAPVLAANDAVPFRFTPNLQHFLGPIFTEGILAAGIMAYGRCLTEPEYDLEQQLCLFARDEVSHWLSSRGKPWSYDLTFRQFAAALTDGVVKRAEAMACKVEREQAMNNPQNPPNVPVLQTVTNMISTATNPIQLMKMTEIFVPWY